MRTLTVSIMLFGLMAAPPVLGAGSAPLRLHEAPQPLPEIAFADEAGDPVTLDRWRGKVVLLNIWATWCGPCRTEMPTLDRLQAALGGDDFAVVALSIDRAGASVVREFFDDTGIGHLEVFVDTSMQAASELRLLGLPGTLLIGPQGQELARHMGVAEWDAPVMLAFIAEVITRTTAKEPKS